MLADCGARSLRLLLRQLREGRHKDWLPPLGFGR